MFWDKIKQYLLNSSETFLFYKNHYDISQDRISFLEEENKDLLFQIKSLNDLHSKIDDLDMNFKIFNKDIYEDSIKFRKEYFSNSLIFQSKLDSVDQSLNLINSTNNSSHIETMTKLNDYLLKIIQLQSQLDGFSDDFDNLRHINFSFNSNDGLELLNKSINLIQLNIEELKDILAKKEDNLDNCLDNFNNNLNYTANLMEYLMFYQTYSNRFNHNNNKKFIKNIYGKDNMNDYLVSIVVPLYNIEKSFLLRAFNSITMQTIGFENLEVIFVDDCSSFKEGTYFAKELSDIYSNVKIIFLDSNVGTGQSRNFGLNNASGEYIMFLDQDDVYLPDACEILYNEIINDNSDMVCGNYINLSRDGPDKVDWSLVGIDDYCIKTDNINEHMELFKVDPSIWAKIFSRDFIKKNNIRFCEYYGGDDLLFYHEALFKAGTIVNIDEPIVIYEQRTNKNADKISFSLNNSFSALKDLIEIYLCDYALFKEYNDEYVDIPLNSLNYFVVRRLKYSSLTFDEYKELIGLGKELFDGFVSLGMETVPYFNKMFEYIANDDLENAFLEYKKIISS